MDFTLITVQTTEDQLVLFSTWRRERFFNGTLVIVFAIFVKLWKYKVPPCAMFPVVSLVNWPLLDFISYPSSSCRCFRAQSEDRRPPEDAVLGQAVRDRALPAVYADRPGEQ